VDYIIADPIVLPLEQQPFYTEKIVHLPDSFQVNDTQRQIASTALTRAAAGLPETGIVFCCFNKPYKITAPVFDIWMRLLKAVDASVLWLADMNEAAAANLRTTAMVGGIDPARLVFAAKAERLDDHLARHRLADLFLDTLPYNAHATASDALWAGLPVVTCTGNAFAGRVGASLVTAVGLPDLVAPDLAGYEALALRLAKEPDALADCKRRLEQKRLTAPLFAIDRFLHHLEAAYLHMHAVWRGGKPPKGFAVQAD
jgi:protein O-GlcNAc transferase